MITKNNIFKMIDKLCPDGVEYMQIKDICNISRGRIISKNYIRNNFGKYPVYSSQTENEGILGSISTFDYYGEYITWTTDGANAGTIFYRSGKFNITNVCGLLKINTDKILTKYLYFELSILAPKYVNKGMGNPKLMSNVMEKIKIPLPPLEIQEEIVRILDKFTKNTEELKINLDKEFMARKKQYEYYRDKLLTFGDSVEYVELGEVANIYDGTHKTPDYKDSGIPFISVENIKDIYNYKKFISKEEYEKYKIKPQINDLFMTRIGKIGDCSVMTKDTPLAFYVSLALIRMDKNKLNSKFLKYVIESKTGKKELNRRILFTAVPIKINKCDITKIKIPLPPLETQEKIVNILDRFDALCNDITKGIPAEIEARQKQYEYYRDKLLNFKEVKK